MTRTRIFTYATAFALAFSPQIAQASPTEVYNLIFSGDGDGYTNMLLSQVFGSLFAPAGAPVTGSIFTVFLGYFNTACFLLAGVMLFWTASVGIIQSAHEGQVMGQRWSSAWVPLRLLFVGGLLMPLPGNDGYNTGQSFVAFLVKGGTAVASKTWEVGAGMVITGVSPVSAPAARIDEKLATKIFKAEACRSLLNRTYAQTATALGDSVRSERIIVNTKADYDDSYRTTLSYDRVDANGSIKRNGVAVCGSISTPDIPEFLQRRLTEAPTTGQTSISQVVSNTEALRMGFAAMHTDVINDLRTGFGTIVDHIDPQAMLDGTVTASASTLPGGIPSITAVNINNNLEYDLTGAINHVMTRANSTLTGHNNALMGVSAGIGDVNDDVREMMIDRIGGECATTGGGTTGTGASTCYGEGWIGAGSWYMTIAHLNNEIYSLFSASSDATGPSDNPYPYSGIWQSQKDGGNFSSENALYQKQMAAFETLFADSTIPLASLGFRFTPDQLSKVSFYAEAPEREGFFGWVMSIKDSLGNEIKQQMIDLVGMFHDFTFDQDPIISIWALGNHLVGFGTGLAALDTLLPGSIASTVGTILFTAGAGMAFVLPSLPFILWTMGVAGYILMVIEAMVSVNLWALTMMKMDGEGLSGEAGRKGWMVMLTLGSTPMLMIGGFLAGMLVFRITTAIIGAFMGMALSGIVSVGITASIAGAFVCGIMMFIFYIFIIERSFSLISTFPSAVMSMIGESVNFNMGNANDARTLALGGVAAGGKASSALFSGANAIGDAVRGKLAARTVGKIVSGGKGGGAPPASS